MTLASGTADNAGFHQPLCCCETTMQICSGNATASARLRASSSKEFPPRNEQNCLGTATPKAVVVTLCNRLPSPPASTMAHVFSKVLMGSSLRRYLISSIGPKYPRIALAQRQYGLYGMYFVPHLRRPRDCACSAS